MESTNKYLFRGKTNNGKWMFGNLADFNDFGTIKYCIKDGDIWDEVDPITVGRSACIGDKDNNRLFEGDLRILNGKLYKLVDDGFRFRFERNLVEFGENKSIVVDEDTAYESQLVGNIHDNPTLLLKNKSMN